VGISRLLKGTPRAVPDNLHDTHDRHDLEEESKNHDNAIENQNPTSESTTHSWARRLHPADALARTHRED
jgi:hypothetical protein